MERGEDCRERKEVRSRLEKKGRKKRWRWIIQGPETQATSWDAGRSVEQSE